MPSTRTSEGPVRIERPSLAGRIGAGLAQGSVLLVAPAGYGKTLAIEEALRDFGAPVARVFCSEESRDPGRLLIALADALAEPLPGIADGFRRRLTGGAERVEPEAALTRLLDELERVLVEPLVVAVEDAEHLADSADAAALAGVILAARASKVRAVVSSRRPLPLRSARLKASGRLLELGAGELLFSPDECAEFLRRRYGREPSHDEVGATMQRTEGWPLGIALGELAGPEAVRLAPHSRENLFGYLAEEVFEHLDEPDRAALLASALPEELDANLASALGLPEGFLETMPARLGLFLRAVGSGQGSLRFHPLLREYLLRRLAAERTEEELRRLHVQVATGLGAGGRTIEAVEHWLAAARWPEAVEAIGECGFGLLRSASETVRGWLARLPLGARDEPPMLMLEGQLAYGAGDHGRAAELQRRALAGWEARGERPMVWAARIALMNTLHASGGFDEAIALAGELGSPEAAEVPAAPNLAVMAAMCLSLQGRFEEAERMLRGAREHPEAAPSASLALACEGLFLDRPAGRLKEAARKARAALAELERSDPFERAPFVRALLHLVLEEQGHDELALQETLRAQEEARRIGVEGYLVAMLQLHSVGIYARSGRLEEADRELARAVEFEHGTGWRQVSAAQATLAAERGQLDRAAELAETTLARVKQGPFLQRVHAVAFLVPVLVRCGRPDRAREAVEETLACRRDGFYRGRLLALRAWLREMAGDEGWSDDFAQAWEESDGGQDDLLRREWPRLEPLLWRALERGAIEPEGAVAAVQDAFPGGTQLVPLVEHPSPAVRRAAVGPALLSGHPLAARSVDRLTGDADPDVAATAQAAVEQLRRAPPPLRFRLLGGFEARRGLWLIDDEAWQRPMATRVVRFLLLRRGHSVTEDDLFEAFWPGRDPDSARRSLQVAVSQARTVLDPPGIERSVIQATERVYRLELRDGDGADSDDFEAAAAAALAEQGPARRALLERGAALWTGEPLPEERYADWASGWREALVDRNAELLAALVAECRAAGDTPAELHAARRLVGVDSLNESAQRDLIGAYARAGRRGDALHQYLECRRTMVDALGVEPSAETSALHAQVLAGEPL